jgi:hypothetical protein
MKRQSKLHQQQESLSSQQQEAAARQFESVEDMLRYDALHTPVPPTIEHRLQKSASSLPTPPKGWWRKLFSGQ